MKIVETEVTIYAKITNPKGLEKADAIEHHIQLERLLPPNGKCRVRKTMGVGHEKIEFTLKVKPDATTQKYTHTEHTVPVDEDFLNSFQRVADCKYIKTRYKFISKNVSIGIQTSDGGVDDIELPEVIYEVDVFKKHDGENSEWCKIDIELDKVTEYITKHHPNVKKLRAIIKISHLPFKPVQGMERTRSNPEVERRIQELYATEYRLHPSLEPGSE